jgi:hypothetical protein
MIPPPQLDLHTIDVVTIDLIKWIKKARPGYQFGTDKEWDSLIERVTGYRTEEGVNDILLSLKKHITSYSSQQSEREPPHISSSDLLLIAHDEWKRREERKHLHDHISWVNGWISGFLTSRKFVNERIEYLHKQSNQEYNKPHPIGKRAREIIEQAQDLAKQDEQEMR